MSAPEVVVRTLPPAVTSAALTSVTFISATSTFGAIAADISLPPFVKVMPEEGHDFGGLENAMQIKVDSNFISAVSKCAKYVFHTNSVVVPHL